MKKMTIEYELEGVALSTDGEIWERYKRAGVYAGFPPVLFRNQANGVTMFEQPDSVKRFSIARATSRKKGDPELEEVDAKIEALEVAGEELEIAGKALDAAKEAIDE